MKCCKLDGSGAGSAIDILEIVTDGSWHVRYQTNPRCGQRLGRRAWDWEADEWPDLHFLAMTSPTSGFGAFGHLKAQGTSSDIRTVSKRSRGKKVAIAVRRR